MNGLSALTLVKNRSAHLLQMLEGFRRSNQQPSELIIVDMDPAPPALPDTPFPVRRLRLPTSGLPLAQARNLAAAAAQHDSLLFLDVDCIPMRGLCSAMHSALAAQDALICAEIRYLGPEDADQTWDEDDLRRTARPHPVRQFPKDGQAACDNPGLFWSLGFGIRRESFRRLNGFDEIFTGYGAEDTDFGFRAHRQNLPLMLLGGIDHGIGAFHQHHPVYDPPLQHFADILRNAKLFRTRWGCWPMQGWLKQFEQMGLVSIRASSIDLIRRPTADELDAVKSVVTRF